MDNGENHEVEQTNEENTDEVEEEFDPAQYPPNPDDIALVKAAADGHLDEVKELIARGADPCYQDLSTGMSVLMAASGAGYVPVVEYLLEEGAPWNAVDRQYLCAGDYATRNNQQEVITVLMNHAVVSEMLLGTVLRNEHSNLNTDYLKSEVNYTEEGDKLLDDAGLAVMMDWEQPLMHEHAKYICHVDDEQYQQNSNREIRVLNIGFGMGIVDTEIQKFKPMKHTIIEAHPQVISRMKAADWHNKPGVEIVEGRWQDVIDQLDGPFDGVFFDTYAEADLDLHEFHGHLDKLLSKTGRYSYYNGMCPDNVFFHAVACEVVRLYLSRLGFDCKFESFKVDVADPKIWEGVKQRYWHFDTYYIPKCVRASRES